MNLPRYVFTTFGKNICGLKRTDVNPPYFCLSGALVYGVHRPPTAV